MFRCELCDSYLPFFQSSRLCEVCYKIRTIIKCYSAKAIHSHISSVFLVDIKEETDEEIATNEELEKPSIKEVLTELKTRNQKKKYSDII